MDMLIAFLVGVATSGALFALVLQHRRQQLREDDVAKRERKRFRAML